ncbi:MAG: hypothetical protein HWN65_24490 [Candidatus Helarchaeota archaeon]|nr:hypothetical protein [Candidatus Helarchaeota archaeon]
MIDIDAKEIYQLILALSSYTELKRKILLCLAHIYPRAVSGAQLTSMIGYSGQARTLYRGVLDRLKADDVIFLDRMTPKLFSIRINHKHHLMKLLIELSQTHGEKLKKEYNLILDKDEKNE